MRCRRSSAPPSARQGDVDMATLIHAEPGGVAGIRTLALSAAGPTATAPVQSVLSTEAGGPFRAPDGPVASPEVVGHRQLLVMPTAVLAGFGAADRVRGPTLDGGWRRPGSSR